MKQSKKGFTLVEIMIVVAIIGILAAIAIPNFVRYRKSAQANACIGNLKQLQSAVEQLRMAKGEGATPTLSNLCGATLYMKTTPVCPAQPDQSYTFTGDEYVPTCKYEAGEGYPAHKLPDDDGTSGS